MEPAEPPPDATLPCLPVEVIEHIASWAQLVLKDRLVYLYIYILQRPDARACATLHPGSCPPMRTRTCTPAPVQAPWALPSPAKRAPLRPAAARRVSLASCCRALWLRPDVLASPMLWGEVEVEELDPGGRRERAQRKLAALAAWLARRRPALRSLSLDCGGIDCDAQELLCALCGTGVRELSLGANPAVGEDRGGMLQPLAQLTSLRSLALDSCSLLDLDPRLLQLTGLQSLLLGSNPLGEAAAEGGMPTLAGLTRLTLLDMQDCGLARLPRQLSALTALAALQLEQNVGLGAHPDAFEPLHHLSGLTFLDLRRCGLCCVPEQFSALGALRHLALVGNPSLGRDPQRSCRHLQHLTCLQNLCLSYCGFSALPRELAALTALQGLKLSHNSLGGGGDATFEPLRPMTGITFLDLQVGWAWVGAAA